MHATSLVPPGTRTIIFESIDKRFSFVNDEVEDLYTGQALENYRYYKIYYYKTRKIRVGATIILIPFYCEAPYPSSIDIAFQISIYLTQPLGNP